MRCVGKGGTGVALAAGEAWFGAVRFSAAVLAGGQSRRMGRDKALLPVPPHRTLIERQLRKLMELGPCEALVSIRMGQRVPVPASVTRVRDDGVAGPLGGLVHILRGMRTPRVFVLAVDVAGMDSATMRRIAGAAPEDESVGMIPRTITAPQPLAALWPRTMLPLAEAQVAAGIDFSMRSLVERGLAAGMLRWLDVPSWDERQFANWNRPRDIRI